MKYRTDLAMERMEMLEEEAQGKPDLDGIEMEKVVYDDDLTAVRIRITSPVGAEKLGKPEGTYITIEAAGVLEETEGIKERAGRALHEELRQLIGFHDRLKVLVAGLGNHMVTPDALGPFTAAKIKVTRHLFLMFGADRDDEMSSVSCIVPGVAATTGMETADLIRKAVELTKPEVVIVIDSLAARSIERVSTTIQITDTGISPGAGLGNNRTGVNAETAGAKVIAIGVPTVIDAATIIQEALESHEQGAEAIEAYMQRYDTQMVVTSSDIDAVIKDFSDIIANGINKTLHPGIYS